MKKTLLALAAIAASSAAFAQSSVTLYGVVDASVESVRGDKTVTRVSSDNLATSRLGFKGTEDLGGGTKANFQLETALKTDTGTADATFWGRQAWVGLAGGFGDLRLGRTDSLIGEIAGQQLLGNQAYDELKILGTRAAHTTRRVSNSITYGLPTFVPGLSVAFQYTTAGSGGTGLGDESATNDSGKSIGISVKYAAGPLAAGLGYLNAKDEASATAGDQKANATLAYGSYDFGAAKVIAYYNTETTPAAFAAGTRRLTVAGAKVAVPFSPDFTLYIGGATGRNNQGSDAQGDNVQVTSIKGVYSLSKRTAVYGLFTNVNNGTATNNSLGYNDTFGGTVSADRTVRGFAVGVRHSF